MIIKDKEIYGGEPIIKGHRISVANIIELYQIGWTVDEILKQYPQLKREQIIECFDYYKNNKSEINLILLEENEV